MRGYKLLQKLLLVKWNILVPKNRLKRDDEEEVWDIPLVWLKTVLEGLEWEGSIVQLFHVRPRLVRMHDLLHQECPPRRLWEQEHHWPPLLWEVLPDRSVRSFILYLGGCRQERIYTYMYVCVYSSLFKWLIMYAYRAFYSPIVRELARKSKKEREVKKRKRDSEMRERES